MDKQQYALSFSIYKSIKMCNMLCVMWNKTLWIHRYWKIINFGVIAVSRMCLFGEQTEILLKG